MNDSEWLNLRGLWNQEKGQLPADFQRYAQRQAYKLLGANIVFWTIVVSESAFATWRLVHESSAMAKLDGWVILGTVSMLSAWFVSMQRRLWPKPFEIPSEMLTRFERHLSRSEVAAWIGAGGFFALSLFALIQGAILSGGIGSLWSTSRALFVQAFIALLFLAIWPRWVTHRTQLRKKRIRTWREEIAGSNQEAGPTSQ